MAHDTTADTADDVQTVTDLTEDSDAFVSTSMTRPRDPETRAHEREIGEWGEFEVVLVHEDYGILGTLDETFESEAVAAWAVADDRISQAGVESVVRPVDTETTESESGHKCKNCGASGATNQILDKDEYLCGSCSSTTSPMHEKSRAKRTP